MTCGECNLATDQKDKVAYYRIGNSDLGWGNIGLIGCPKHVVLAIDRLNLWGDGRGSDSK